MIKGLKALFLLVFIFLKASCTAKKDCAYNGGDLVYLQEIKCQEDLTALAAAPLKTTYSNIKSVKIIYEITTDKIYFINSKVFKFHFTFCNEYLQTYTDLSLFNKIEYSDKPNRKYALCNLNYYESSNEYVLEFFADDKINISAIEKLFTKVKKSTFFNEKVSIANNSINSNNWLANENLKFISMNKLYEGQSYQALKTGICIGYLRFINEAEYSLENIKPNDIVILNNLPNNLPICSGFISSVYQTPLCHINVLSQNRGTPNCVIKNALNNQKLINLKNKLVKLEIRNDGFTILESTQIELNKFIKKQKSNLEPVNLKCDLSIKNPISLLNLSIKNINSVGGKAANLAELAKIKIDKSHILSIPENAFAIPFYFYKNHLKENQIEGLINSLNYINSDKPQLIELKLKEIRNLIEKSALSEKLLLLIIEKIPLTDKTDYRFRSSTNAEDIPGFNGAGLYDSKTGTNKTSKKSIEKAIKKVWSSLWNTRAYYERRFFNINSENLAMGVLVHKAFGTEEANGVAITKNLYRNEYSGFTINVQKGETSVVQPNDSIRAEQFIINNSKTITGEKDNISVDFICHSSMQPLKPILSEKEIELLYSYLESIKKHYWKILPHKFKSYQEFGIDVEFKLEKKTRRLVIKQARVY